MKSCEGEAVPGTKPATIHFIGRKVYSQNQVYPQIKVHRRSTKDARIDLCHLEEFDLVLLKY